MEKKLKLKLLEATADVNTVTEETELIVEDSEEEETETMASETTEEDPEETLATDQRDASTAERTAILPETVKNVSFFINLARKPREFNRERNDRNDDRGGYKRRSRSRSGDRHKKHRKRSSSNSSR
jgi:hypothetical protein